MKNQISTNFPAASAVPESLPVAQLPAETGAHCEAHTPADAAGKDISDTPRTDRLMCEEASGYEVVWEEEYMKLERELAALRADVKPLVNHCQWCDELGIWFDGFDSFKDKYPDLAPTGKAEG